MSARRHSVVKSLHQSCCCAQARTDTNVMKPMYEGKHTLRPIRCTTVEMVRHGNAKSSSTKTPVQNEPRKKIVPSPTVNRTMKACVSHHACETNKRCAKCCYLACGILFVVRGPARWRRRRQRGRRVKGSRFSYIALHMAKRRSIIGADRSAASNTGQAAAARSSGLTSLVTAEGRRLSRTTMISAFAHAERVAQRKNVCSTVDGCLSCGSPSPSDCGSTSSSMPDCPRQHQ
jgi:hypothetical protein